MRHVRIGEGSLWMVQSQEHAEAIRHLGDVAELPTVFRLFWPLASAHSFAPQVPEQGGADGSGAGESANEVAHQLRDAPPPEPEPVAHLVPEQAYSPAAAPASPTQVPESWRASDAVDGQRTG